MKENRHKFILAMLFMALLLCVSPCAASAASKTTPGKVTLSKISATAYNKVKVSWKKATGASKYYIYYRKNGASKWTKIATVSSSKTSYTHTSSKKYPIVVGQKYNYTVRAYNSKSKKLGKYNTKGLTVKTVPGTVKLKEAILTSSKTKVAVYWKSASGCDRYRIYRRTAGTDWKLIATVKSSANNYTDKTPVKGQTNYYTVRAYYTKTKALGGYDKEGVAAAVPGQSSSSTPSTEASVIPVSYVMFGASTGMRTYVNLESGTYTLDAAVFPSNATDKTLTWSSSDSSVATVNSSGVATLLKCGTVTIKAQASSGASASFTFVVVDTEAYIQEAIELTNQERAKVGKAPLLTNANLQKAAMVRAKEISTYFSHTRPNGQNEYSAVTEAGASYPSGENIASGYLTPEAVVNGWMNSLGHRANIMDAEQRYIGVGFYIGDDGCFYWTQEFTSGNPDDRSTLTLDLMGGTIDGSSSYSITGPCGLVIYTKDLPVPVKPGYTFSGWYSTPDFERWTAPLNSLGPNGTIYAKWT